MKKLWKKNNKGQAAVEFIMVAVVVFFFLFFFFSTAVLMIMSDYMEYATFMAARTYRTQNSETLTDTSEARQVFDAYVNRVLGVVKPADSGRVELVPVGGNQPGDARRGLVSSYKMALFYLPPLFIDGATFDSNVLLSNEVRLGKDPGPSSCEAFFQDFAQTQFGDSSIAARMEDNGC